MDRRVIAPEYKVIEIDNVDSRRLIGGVEAGGTKFVCAIGHGESAEILERQEFATGRDPASVIAAVGDWFDEQQRKHHGLSAMGIASFGPVSLDPSSSNYGCITSTPKPGWMNTNVAGYFANRFSGLPIGFDTDVNGAGLAEHLWGNAKDLRDFLYITMGTGIGGGGMSGGSLLHGLVHPEMGHLLIPPIPGDEFDGICPYHGRCWEGLCSGPAIKARTGIDASNLPADHKAWQLVAQYTALALANLIFTLSPSRIIIGGSVRKGGLIGEAKFFEMIRQETVASLGNYIQHAVFQGGIDEYIVPPRLADNAGVAGAIGLGKLALDSPRTPV